MKSYIKNNNKGTIVETIKNKPTGSVKGMAKIELINDKTGEVEVEGLSKELALAEEKLDVALNEI